MVHWFTFQRVASSGAVHGYKSSTSRKMGSLAPDSEMCETILHERASEVGFSHEFWGEQSPKRCHLLDPKKCGALINDRVFRIEKVAPKEKMPKSFGWKTIIFPKKKSY